MFVCFSQTAFASEKTISTTHAIAKKKVNPSNSNRILFAKMAISTSKKQRAQNKQYLLNESLPYPVNETD